MYHILSARIITLLSIFSLAAALLVMFYLPSHEQLSSLLLGFGCAARLIGWGKVKSQQAKQTA